MKIVVDVKSTGDPNHLAQDIRTVLRNSGYNKSLIDAQPYAGPSKINIKWHVPIRQTGAYPIPIWPENWPIPNVGDIVYVAPGQPALWVKAVDYFPSGEEVGDQPFIYVILSENAPR